MGEDGVGRGKLLLCIDRLSEKIYNKNVRYQHAKKTSSVVTGVIPIFSMITYLRCATILSER